MTRRIVFVFLLSFIVSIQIIEADSYSVFGNSISTYKGYIPSDYNCWFTEEHMKVEETWWYQVGISMKWTLCNNSSWSGSRVSYDKDWEYKSYFISPIRINNLSENGIPDHILILGGVNDWRWSLNHLGSIEDTDSTVFCGAYKLMLDRIKDKYPSSKIYCISILPIAENGYTNNSFNSKGWSISQANDCIRDICRIKNISFIDMNPCLFSENVNLFTADGLHPNVEGMKLIADYIIQKLKDISNATAMKGIEPNNPNRRPQMYDLNGLKIHPNSRSVIIRQNDNGSYSKMISK